MTPMMMMMMMKERTTYRTVLIRLLRRKRCHLVADDELSTTDIHRHTQTYTEHVQRHERMFGSLFLCFVYFIHFLFTYYFNLFWNIFHYTLFLYNSRFYVSLFADQPVLCFRWSTHTHTYTDTQCCRYFNNYILICKMLKCWSQSWHFYTLCSFY